MMSQTVPKYHVIEKEDEVVFYIPYDRELVNVYTPEFFGLHSQNAEIAVVAFHNNDSLIEHETHVDKTFAKESYASEPYVGGVSDIQMPYRAFYDRAKYIDNELNKRLNGVPSKISSYHLFSALIDNAREIFKPINTYKPKEPASYDPQPVVEEPVTTPPVIKEPVTTPPVVEEPVTTPPVVEEPVTTPPVIEDIEEPVSYESKEIYEPEPITESATTPLETSIIEEPVTTPLERLSDSVSLEEDGLPALLQITIQKKPIVITQSKPKLKIPMDVMLEKEIDYFNEHAPMRTISEKYALHGIYMVA